MDPGRPYVDLKGGGVMTGITHAAAGAAIGAAAGALGGAAAAGAAAGGLAALLPDLDHPGSYAGQRLRLLACWLEERFGHRESPTHTLFFAALAGLILGITAAIVLKAPLLALSGVLGGVSHIVLDGMTRSGVKPYRVYLPKLPGKLEKWRQAEKWNSFAARAAAHAWAGRQWRGDIHTGQDGREAAICAASLVLLLILFMQSYSN
ncbi:hypothetical membrane protein [Pelotomaculum thermopropionicum SI]|uniref:Hypothetical membrane protein n=1 Tax=Pelotomaculum thermopropionicum (strain DSM 13744 / JCM 10971 / SI) TaxID=370438 RepID=A5CZD2_PELTS|nr:hypothetical membrane protein [Pelotomaculum thermopropionicum SI]